MPLTRHVERHFTSGETVRDIVIGMSDGLTVPFALAAGLSGAVESTSIVITAGLAEIAAGSIAMGLGGYLAARSDAEHYASERRREQNEIRDIPAAETQEVIEVLAAFRRRRRSRCTAGERAASAARVVDRFHDAVRARSRKTRPEAGFGERGHDRRSVHCRRADSARPLFHVRGRGPRTGHISRVHAARAVRVWVRQRSLYWSATYSERFADSARRRPCRRRGVRHRARHFLTRSRSSKLATAECHLRS